MNPRTTSSMVALVALVAAVAAVGAVSVVGLSTLGGLAAVIGTGFVLTWMAFTLWPWAVMPTGIVGGTIASVILGSTDVRMIVIMHALPLAAGYLAVFTRRLAGYDRDRPRGYARVAVLVSLALAACAAYGLAVGNEQMNVAIATYQIAVIPVYFFLTVYTLGTQRQRRYGGILFISAITVLTAMSFAVPGRHGGLLSLLAVPPLIVLTGRSSGWRRTGFALLATGFTADVVMSSYRGMWLAGIVAVVTMVVFGGRAVRRGVLVTGMAAIAAYLVVASSGLVRTFDGRSVTVLDALNRDAGYRLPEAKVGMEVFASHPILGAGLGQTTPGIYLYGFTITDVGPVYHAFYVLVLANLGLVGLCAIGWPILRLVGAGLAQRDGLALAFAALTCGFLANATVSSPSDGHWELGLLPALILVVLRPSPRPRAQQQPASSPTLASGPALVGVGP